MSPLFSTEDGFIACPLVDVAEVHPGIYDTRKGKNAIFPFLAETTTWLIVYGSTSMYCAMLPQRYRFCDILLNLQEFF